MALVKALSRVNKQGQIAIPRNIRKEAGLKEGQLVEIKVQGMRSSQINIRVLKKPFSFSKGKNLI